MEGHVDLTGVAAELEAALDAAGVSHRLTAGDGWLQIELSSATDNAPAPGLISALHRADEYATSHSTLHTACVYPAQARWLAEGLRALVASGAAPR
ncbi:hypothetical protein [Streptacidiphilus anmyonensis]|uniref:hypothetical protein n=1 Tax=Streptacidiphilus anmyonensis TaxID=405782 RepID=UPI0005A814A3|nr:hypothetical protein [Streptacidiphilus anmyonensis]